MSILYNKVGSIAREKEYIRLPYAFDHNVYIETQKERFVQAEQLVTALESNPGIAANLKGLISENFYLK